MRSLLGRNRTSRYFRIMSALLLKRTFDSVSIRYEASCYVSRKSAIPRAPGLRNAHLTVHSTHIEMYQLC